MWKENYKVRHSACPNDVPQHKVALVTYENLAVEILIARSLILLSKKATRPYIYTVRARTYSSKCRDG